MGIYILTAVQRSGTGALGSLLNRSDEISYLGEVFRPDTQGIDYYYFSYLLKKAKENSEYIIPGSREIQFGRINEYFDYLQSINTKKHTLIDIKYNSLHIMDQAWKNITEEPTMIGYMLEHKIPVISLTRHNLIQLYVSARLAEANNVWHATESREIRHSSVTVNTDDVYWWMVLYDYEIERMRYFLRHHPRQITLEYSQLFNPDGTLREHAEAKLESFFECNGLKELKPEYIKQSDNDLRKKITNYDELCVRLSNTKFEWMLYE